MADISAQNIPELGNLMTAFPRNQADIDYKQGPQTQLAQAQTGQAQANTGLINQQTQKAAFEIGLMKQAMESLKDLPTGAERSGEQAIGDPTETGVASILNQKFQPPNPLGPDGFQKYINATAWVNPAESQRASDMRDKYVQGQTIKNQTEANDIFQTATSLNAADAGLDGLMKTTHPGSFLNNVGMAIAANKDMSPEDKDQAARTAIAAAAKYSHQYTGREITPAGDQHVDKTTGFPVAAPPIGPTAGERIDIGKWANTPQTVTIDNRASTIKPRDLGIRSYQDLTNNRSIKFSVPPPGGAGQINTSGTAPAGAPGSVAKTPAQARAATTEQGGSPIPGLSPEQSDFIKNQPPGFPAVKGNSALNGDDLKERDIYRDQAKKLSESTNTEADRAHASLAQISRVNALLQTPNLTLGPSSHEYSQFRTVLENWLGVPSGQAAAYQVLAKVLNASEMNDLLQQLHSEGAQVRLGAYESRLIMEKLAANPNLTKSAIQQMLTWQASDAKYAIDKTKVASAAMQTGKSISNFDTNYGNAFPKENLIDNTLHALNPKVGLNFAKAAGKTYTPAQVSEAAAHAGIPKILFEEQLRKAGAKVQ